jgi:hypothetical protein
MKYKDLKGDMLVPRRFLVPVNDITWPKETWGMNLGTFVNNIRAGNSHADKQGDLESIGFNFNRIYGFEVVKVALMKYKDLNGDVLVPQKFVVPINDISWPEETWGIKLGRDVGNIRAKSYADKREDLESIGFDFNSQRLFYGFEVVKLALMKYKDLNGDVLVPQKFVVPINDISWPDETWGIKLGRDVKLIGLPMRNYLLSI